MSEKFDNVPVEDDTRVLMSQPAHLGDYEVLYQQWAWEGIRAESVIFARADIEEVSDEKLEELVRESPLVSPESRVTIQHSDAGFTFCNFNFEMA